MNYRARTFLVKVREVMQDLIFPHPRSHIVEHVVNFIRMTRTHGLPPILPGSIL
jgi:hypothetical protein